MLVTQLSLSMTLFFRFNAKKRRTINTEMVTIWNKISSCRILHHEMRNLVSFYK